MCEISEYIKMTASEISNKTFNLRRTCESTRRLDGKVVVITGANTGIGKETALQLSLRGAKIYIGCRSMDKAEAAIKEIREQNPKADITSLKLDLSSLKSVRQFANQIQEKETVIDLLINNAGVMACPEWKTADGFEMQLGTNYIGPFLLTLLLLPMLKKSPRARIVNVSSSMYRIGKIHYDNLNLQNGEYNPNKAYGQSKLAMLLFTRELVKRLGDDSKINVYVLHPGAIKTDLQRHVNFGDMVEKIMFITPELGAQTTLYCALDESLDNETGQYYDNCRKEKMNKAALDEDSAKRLWDLTVELVGLEQNLRI